MGHIETKNVKVQVSHLTKKFGDLLVLDDVSFHVNQGDLILFDFGATVDRYISDWTRTFCCGAASPEQKELYRLTRRIERSCIEAVKPGVRVSDLMELAQGIARRHPLGQWFNPFLGHSVGLASSEWPLLQSGVETVLEAGMVLTIEPGIYLPGVGGVRIEDEVLVTSTGHEVWTGPGGL